MSQQTNPQKQVEYHPNELIFIQSRAEINLAIVAEYSELMADGIVFDPVEGVQDENGIIFVFDGQHRGEAANKAGTTLLVNLRPGNRSDAEWLALAANQKHGLRRTNKDKQRVVHQALLHPYGVNLSNSELARHCGVNDKTVAKIRCNLELSSEIPKIDQRIVKRNGITYEQNTRNIGNTQRERPAGESQSATTAISRQPGPTLSHVHQGTTQPDQIHAFERTYQWPEDVRPGIRSDVDEQPMYQPIPQEFNCPRCGEEKIVGVNGSRRWCLNCLAEWPTAATFLAEVNAICEQQDIELPTRQQLQYRFLNILTQLDEHDARLSRINAWLDMLDAQLDLTDNVDNRDETMLPIASIPMLEYA
jgi:hypothetical protein